MYIGDTLGRRAIYSPDKLAVIDAGKEPALRLTYREMNARANRLAHWLRHTADVQKGDRVAILARDGVEHLDCFYACGKLGVIHTAFNWRLHWRELESLIQDTRPKVLIFSEDFTENVNLITGAVAGQPHEIGRYIHVDGAGITGSLRFNDVMASSSPEHVTCETLEKEDIACLVFTGGTTGLPKGAMISHRMISWNILNTVTHDLTHGDIYLCVFPLFHAGGLFTYITSQMVFGNTTILTRQFDPAQVLDLIEREKVTVFAGVPTMYQMMTLAPNWETADLSSLRFCTSGGAPLPVPIVEKYTQEKGIRFKQGFGMTEFGVGIFALAPEDAIRKAGSIGRPNFFVDVRVVDEEGRDRGPNQVGEMLLKGPSMMSGYWEKPEETARVIDAEGWLHTGDLVYYDEEWYFYVADRKKDMFISGGENVYPKEIEEVLYRHPAVHMCAVIGIPHEKWGEVGKACVVLKAGQTTSEEELLGYLKDHLASYKVPKSVAFLDALPLSSMGKILKRELRAMFVSLD
jgi:fatty-acyl-CoA synthase